METTNYSDNKENIETYLKNYVPLTSPNWERKTLGSEFSEDCKSDSVNGLPPSELRYNQENKKYVDKVEQIKSILQKKPVDVDKLKKLAVIEGGLVNDDIRKVVWPLLLDVTDAEVPKYSDDKELENHPEYQQVVLDVNRSLRRFPPGIPLEQRLALQNQLTLLILRVVTAHPRLKYYQGYHDVAVTLLLVTGLEAAYVILEKLSTNHLKDCMEPTMEKTSHLLNYIFPLVKHQNKEVHDHLEKSGVGTMFALPWFLTWFGHSLNQYSDVVRLFDYFLASEPLSPLYLSAVIIVFRHKEILSTPCDMASLHSLLSQIPDNLPFESLLLKATELFKKHPPEEIEIEAKAKTKLEEDQRRKELAIRKRRMNQKNIQFVWRMLGRPFANLNGVTRFSRYSYVVATAAFAVGLYAVYLKTVEATISSKDENDTMELILVP